MTTTTNPKAPKGFFAGISGIKSGVANIIDAGKTFKSLGPSQIKDEIQIAKHELKTKGIAVGRARLSSALPPSSVSSSSSPWLPPQSSVSAPSCRTGHRH